MALSNSTLANAAMSNLAKSRRTEAFQPKTGIAARSQCPSGKSTRWITGSESNTAGLPEKTLPRRSRKAICNSLCDVNPTSAKMGGKSRATLTTPQNSFWRKTASRATAPKPPTAISYGPLMTILRDFTSRAASSRTSARGSLKRSRPRIASLPVRGNTHRATPFGATDKFRTPTTFSIKWRAKGSKFALRFAIE